MSQHQFTSEKENRVAKRRQPTRESAGIHPLLQLQQTAGNQAVTNLVTQRQAAGGSDAGGSGLSDQRVDQAINQTLNAPVSNLDLAQYQARMAQYFAKDHSIQHQQETSMGGVVSFDRRALQQGLQSNEDKVHLRLDSGPITFKERHTDFPA